MKVFISYSRADAKETANIIHDYLTKYGPHEVFIDTSNIPYGGDWNEVIQKEISICDIFIIIVTPSALYRSEVEKEVELAKSLKKKIIPCIAKDYVEEDEIKWELNRYQGFFYDRDSKLAMDLHMMIKRETKRKTSNELKTEIKSVQTETILPTIVGTYPINGQKGIPVDSDIVATFSNQMNSSTIDVRTFTLKKNGDTSIIDCSVTLSSGDKDVILNPLSDLEPSTKYTATITKEVKDISGNAMAIDKTWSFETAATETIVGESAPIPQPSGSGGGSAPKPPEDRNSTKTEIEYSSHSAQSYIDKAKDFEYLGQYDRALKQYEKAIEIEPFNFLALYNKALLLERIERFEEALESIEQAIDIEPKNSDVWYHKGRIFEKLEKNEEALKAYQVDLRIDSKDIKSWAGKANILVKLQKYKEALEAYDEILKIDQDNAEAKRNKEVIKELKNHEYSSLIHEIELKFQNKDYSNVIELCENAIKITQNNPILYVYKGNALQGLKRYEEALQCYDRVLEIDPQNTDAMNNRKVIKEQLDKESVKLDNSKYSTRKKDNGGNLDQKEIDKIKLIKTIQHAGDIRSLSITPDNTKIVSGSQDNIIKVWDLETGTLYHTLKGFIKGHSKPVNSLTITPTNAMIVSGSQDNTIKVWYIDTGELLTTLKGHSNMIMSVEITPDNTKIVSASRDNTIKVWQNVSFSLLKTLKDIASEEHLSLSSMFHYFKLLSVSNNKVISGSTLGVIKTWDIDTGELLKTIEINSSEENNNMLNYFTSLVITQDKTKIVTGGWDKTIKVWDIDTGELLKTLKGHSALVISLAVTPDNTKIISGATDDTIKIWDIATGQLLTSFNSSNVSILSVTSDNNKIVNGGRSGIQVWKIEI